MNELQTILQHWCNLGEQANEAVLVTVVHVKGSAYRRPGARMLILPEGKRIGTISGGCLEGDVARKAAWWTADGQSVVRTFDNSSPEVAWEFGLGCNGVITLLLESVDDPSVREALAFINQHLQAASECAIATVIRCSADSSYRIGDRLLWDTAGVVGGQLTQSPFDVAIIEQLQAALAERSNRLLQTADADVFIEWMGLPQRLVIFGAGHDVVPLVTMASLLGWNTTVVDNRAAYAQNDRFPGAAKVVTLSPESDIAVLGIDTLTAVVIMTHNYPQDLLLLPQILERRPTYLGLLGPRYRTEQLFQECGLDMRRYDVHAPVGLDIGGDHPETIALAIVAEIQAVLSHRQGGFLRGREGSIHGAVKVCGQSSTVPEPADETVARGVCDVAA